MFCHPTFPHDFYVYQPLHTLSIIPRPPSPGTTTSSSIVYRLSLLLQHRLSSKLLRTSTDQHITISRITNHEPGSTAFSQGQSARTCCGRGQQWYAFFITQRHVDADCPAHTTLKRPHVPSCLYHCSILQLKATPDTLVDMHPMDRFLAAPSSYHPAIFTEAFTAGTAAADGCTCVSTSPGILASSS